MQKSMGQTEMLEDLVGMCQGLDGDDDLELGSYQNSESFRPKVVHPLGVPSTNTTSDEFKKMGELEELEMKKLGGKEEVSHNEVQ